MTTPSQPTELDKAIERSENMQCSAATRTSSTIGQYLHADIKQLLLTAKRVQELERENDKLKTLLVAIRNSVPTAL